MNRKRYKFSPEEIEALRRLVSAALALQSALIAGDQDKTRETLAMLTTPYADAGKNLVTMLAGADELVAGMSRAVWHQIKAPRHTSQEARFERWRERAARYIRLKQLDPDNLAYNLHEAWKRGETPSYAARRAVTWGENRPQFPRAENGTIEP